MDSYNLALTPIAATDRRRLGGRRGMTVRSLKPRRAFVDPGRDSPAPSAR
jgi:hypothetical protein